MKFYLENIYFEGKQQALQILEKNGFSGYEYNQIEKLDPTSPKNKYVELLARLYIQDDNFIKKAIKDKIADKLATIEQRHQTITKVKDYNDLLSQLQTNLEIITKGDKKLGIKGMTEGKDFIKIPLNTQENIQAYIPLSYKASKVIASKQVGNCVGEWCTAKQKSSEDWDNYIYDMGGILVYIVDASETASAPTLSDENIKVDKYAIYFYSGETASEYSDKLANKHVENGELAEGFDMNDKSLDPTFIPFFKTCQQYVQKNWETIKKSHGKLDINIVTEEMFLINYIYNNKEFNNFVNLLFNRDQIKYGEYNDTIELINKTAFIRKKNTLDYDIIVGFNSEKLLKDHPIQMPLKGGYGRLETSFINNAHEYITKIFIPEEYRENFEALLARKNMPANKYLFVYKLSSML
jgi:hypothetical protein